MANQIGLELLPDTCRVVDVQSASGWFGRKRPGDAPSRVKAFHEIAYSPENPGACAAELRRLLGSRGRDLRMALWGLRSTHQVFMLPQAAPAELELMARREAKIKTPAPGQGNSSADGVVVGEHTDGSRREVGYVSVSPAEIQGRLQAFLNAGLGISSVVTPAVAHAQLVRQRWGQFGDTATAVLAVNARATAMSVIRGGVVLFAREVPWGHDTDKTAVFEPAAFAGQLASELRRSLVFIKQQTKVDVGHVLVCGDLPDLRALTGPLMHELSIEVETLDSLDGFDVAHLPEPADEFRTRIGALRTAWALAVEPSSSVNLQPREASSVRLTPTFEPQTRNRLAVAALAGLVIVGAAWGASEFFVRSTRARLETYRTQVNRLTPEVQRLEETRRTAAVVGARAAALEAFASQGPRLARVLQDLAKGAPGQVAISTLTMVPGPGTWKITINGQALADTPALAQKTFNEFLRSAASSGLMGTPVRPPSIKVSTEEPAAVADVTLDAGSGGGGGTADDVDREVIEPLARPRNVIVADSSSTLTLQERRTAEALGRRAQRVMVEPHWHLHPGGVPKEVAEGVANYNAEQRNWEQAVLTNTGRSVNPVQVERRAGSVLDFTLEFEVRK